MLDRRVRGRLAVIGLFAALMVMVVAGCGSSSSSSSSSTSNSESTTGSEGETTTANEESGGSGVAEAEAEVKRLSDPANFKYPEPPTKPYNTGKHTAAVITCGLAGRGCKLGAEYAQEAFKAAGWSTTPTGDGQFSPTTQAGLIQRAVQEGVSAIWLGAIEAGATKAAIDAAAEAGIPVVCWQCYSGSEFTESGDVMDVVAGGKTSGEVMATYAIAKSGGEGKFLSFVLPEFAIGRETGAGEEVAFEKFCPECELETGTIKASELTEAGPPAWTAALAKNPAGTFEWALFDADSEAIPSTKTAIQSGRSDVQVTGGEGEPEMLQLIKTGEVAAATTYCPVAYAAWAAVDNAIRKANKMSTWDMEGMPVGVIDAENVDTFLKSAPDPYEPPNFPFKEMFKEIWAG